MAKQAPKPKENFKFKVGQSVKYIGEDKDLKGKVYEIQKRNLEKPFLKKPYNSYCLAKKGTTKIIICVAENMLQKYHPDEKKFITDIDKRAREIQKGSGVRKVERVTFYNLTREQAKEQAWAETKNK